jgi:hypothetical protein
LHVTPFATSLVEDGYADNTMQSKLWLLADFGEWLGRSGLAVDERPTLRIFLNSAYGHMQSSA